MSLADRVAFRLDLTKEGIVRRINTPRGAPLLIPPGGFISEPHVADYSFKIFKTRIERGKI